VTEHPVDPDQTLDDLTAGVTRRTERCWRAGPKARIHDEATACSTSPRNPRTATGKASLRWRSSYAREIQDLPDAELDRRLQEFERRGSPARTDPARDLHSSPVPTCRRGTTLAGHHLPLPRPVSQPVPDLELHRQDRSHWPVVRRPSSVASTPSAPLLRGLLENPRAAAVRSAPATRPSPKSVGCLRISVDRTTLAIVILSHVDFAGGDLYAFDLSGSSLLGVCSSTNDGR